MIVSSRISPRKPAGGVYDRHRPKSVVGGSYKADWVEDFIMLDDDCWPTIVRLTFARPIEWSGAANLLSGLDRRHWCSGAVFFQSVGPVSMNSERKFLQKTKRGSRTPKSVPAPAATSGSQREPHGRPAQRRVCRLGWTDSAEEVSD